MISPLGSSKGIGGWCSPWLGKPEPTPGSVCWAFWWLTYGCVPLAAAYSYPENSSCLRISRDFGGRAFRTGFSASLPGQTDGRVPGPRWLLGILAMAWDAPGAAKARRGCYCGSQPSELSGSRPVVFDAATGLTFSQRRLGLKPWTQIVWILSSAAPLTSCCVTLSRLLNLAGVQFLYL